jgi:phosphatidate cytidylyltransferase
MKNETAVRALSGFVYVTLLIFTTIYSSLTFHLFFTVLMCLCIYEIGKLTKNKFAPFISLIGIALSVGIYLTPILPVNFIYVGAGCLLFNILLLFDLFRKRAYNNHNSFSHLLLYGLIPFVLLLILPRFTQPYQNKIVLSIFIMIWCNDTFAYLVGKNFGKHKLMPISPKKTIEGFIGGVVFTLLSGYVISIYFNFFSVTLWICSAVVVSLFGTLGDLVESKFKREAGVKDSGNIMPGHGGALDRLDSIIFATPFLFVLYIIFLHYA